jgi:hypothetical protein
MSEARDCAHLVPDFWFAFLREFNRIVTLLISVYGTFF